MTSTAGATPVAQTAQQENLQKPTVPGPPGDLPTPEASVEPDDARITADQQRQAAEAQAQGQFNAQVAPAQDQAQGQAQSAPAQAAPLPTDVQSKQSYDPPDDSLGHDDEQGLGKALRANQKDNPKQPPTAKVNSGGVAKQGKRQRKKVTIKGKNGEPDKEEWMDVDVMDVDDPNAPPGVPVEVSPAAPQPHTGSASQAQHADQGPAVQVGQTQGQAPAGYDPALITVDLAAGETRDGGVILGHRTFGPINKDGKARGYQFLVMSENSKTRSGLQYDLRSGSELGRRATEAYLTSKNPTLLGEGEESYSKDDASEYLGLKGVACKPIQTKKAGVGFRYPATYCLVALKPNREVWMWRSTLRRILGQKDADEDIKAYYRRNFLPPPWDQPPVHYTTDRQAPGQSSATQQVPTVQATPVPAQPTQTVPAQSNPQQLNSTQANQTAQSSAAQVQPAKSTTVPSNAQDGQVVPTAAGQSQVQAMQAKVESLEAKLGQIDGMQQQMNAIFEMLQNMNAKAQ